MIRFSKIEFINYRQYKSVVVDFSENGQYDLHILRAKNGTGKTTFLNGILWCLYSHEHYLNDQEKALPIVNNSVVQSTVKGSPISVSVKLTLTNGEEVIVFDRTQIFYVKEVGGVKSTYEGEARLRVLITPLNNAANTTVYEDELEVQSLVKQYFDESIYDYYFFDGENLKSYFAKGKSEKIKSSIFNIAQVTLLSNAAEHTRTKEVELSRASKKIKGDETQTLTEEIIALEADIAKYELENKSIDDELPTLKSKYEVADRDLREYSPIRLNTAKRKDLEIEIKNLSDDLNALNAKKKEFIIKYLTLLNLYPRIKATYDLIVAKQTAGNLPPSIDKKQLQHLLDSHSKYCPVCNGTLDERAISHLEALLQSLDVSSATSNFLMEIKGALEEMLVECQKYEKLRDELLSQEKYLRDEIAKKEDEAARISSFLARYSDADQKFDVKKAEADRQRALDRMNSLTTRKTLNESLLVQLKADLESKKQEREKQDGKKEKKDLFDRQLLVYRRLTSRFEYIQNLIMSEIKKDIESQTWNRFETMIWKKNTFGNVTIDDNYEISVYNTTHNEMTGSLSATEYMALAYSFTLAIHDASGKNCPLVVDSPLGRVSDDNRTNMASELLKVSQSKQIIMLFTPDEYSDEVRALYDDNAASIRNICLSENEEEIASIGGRYER